MKFGIVMCTRGRPDKALAFVRALPGLPVPTGTQARLILVDNNETDALRPELEAAAGPFPLTYVHEPRKGLSVARNAGQRALADDETALLVDDDIVLPRTYFSDALTVLARWPDAGLIGGRVELHDPTDYPTVIQTHPEPRRFALDEKIFGFIHGCCMIVPPETRRAHPEFDEKLGAGSVTQSGEDTDYQYRIFRSGAPVIYDPEFHVFHDHGRKTAEDERDLREGWAMSIGAIFAKHIARLDLKMLRYALGYTYWEVRKHRSYAEHPGTRPASEISLSDTLRYRLRGAVRYFAG